MERKDPEPKELENGSSMEEALEERDENVLEKNEGVEEHPPVPDLLSRIEQLEAELNETRNMLKRAHSDVQNVHRRLVREAQLPFASTG